MRAYEAVGNTEAFQLPKIILTKILENPLSKFFEKFSKQTDIPITENGKPVEQNNLTAFIKGILCENLKVCASIASKKSEKEITGQSILEI